MTCKDCKGRPVQSKLFCDECMPDELGWLVKSQEVPDPFFVDRNHAYITPDNRVWVLSNDKTNMVELGTGGHSADLSGFARKEEIITYSPGDGIIIENGKIKTTLTYDIVNEQIRLMQNTLQRSITIIDTKVKSLELKPDKDTTYSAGTNITIDGNNVISANIDIQPILERLAQNDITDAEQQTLLEQLRNSINEIKYVPGEGIEITEGGVINGIRHDAEVSGTEANLYLISPGGQISSLSFDGFNLTLLERGRIRITPKGDVFNKASWDNKLNDIEVALSNLQGSETTNSRQLTEIGAKVSTLEIGSTSLTRELGLVKTSIQDMGQNLTNYESRLTTLESKQDKFIRDVSVSRAGNNVTLTYTYTDSTSKDVTFVDNDTVSREYNDAELTRRVTALEGRSGSNTTYTVRDGKLVGSDGSEATLPNTRYRLVETITEHFPYPSQHGVNYASTSGVRVELVPGKKAVKLLFNRRYPDGLLFDFGSTSPNFPSTLTNISEANISFIIPLFEFTETHLNQSWPRLSNPNKDIPNGYSTSGRVTGVNSNIKLNNNNPVKNPDSVLSNGMGVEVVISSGFRVVDGVQGLLIRAYAKVPYLGEDGNYKHHVVPLDESHLLYGEPFGIDVLKDGVSINKSTVSLKGGLYFYMSWTNREFSLEEI